MGEAKIRQQRTDEMVAAAKKVADVAFAAVPEGVGVFVLMADQQTGTIVPITNLTNEAVGFLLRRVADRWGTDAIEDYQAGEGGNG